MGSDSVRTVSFGFFDLLGVVLSYIGVISFLSALWTVGIVPKGICKVPKVQES